MGLEWAGLQEGCSLQHSQNTPGNTPGLPGESSEHSLPCPVLILPLEEGGVVVVARPHLTPETPSGKVGREEEAPKQLLLISAGCWGSLVHQAISYVGHCPVTFQRAGVADSG